MPTNDPWGDFDAGQPQPSVPGDGDAFAEFGTVSERRRRGRKGLRILLYVGVPILVLVVLSEVFNLVQGRTTSSPNVPRIEVPNVELPELPNDVNPPDGSTTDGPATSNASTDDNSAASESTATDALNSADRPEDLDTFITNAAQSLLLVECMISADEVGQGSGFVMNTQALDGQSRAILVTNWHVIEDCADQGDIALTLSDGSTVSARVVDGDPSEDLAILDASGLNLTALDVESEPGQGDWVMALGNPEGVTGTVAVGVVSSIKPGQILSDASISFGSSGGPLVNNRGAVIGVTSALFSETSSFSISTDIDGLCQKLLSCRN